MLVEFLIPQKNFNVWIILWGPTPSCNRGRVLHAFVSSTPNAWSVPNQRRWLLYIKKRGLGLLPLQILIFELCWYLGLKHLFTQNASQCTKRITGTSQVSIYFKKKDSKTGNFDDRFLWSRFTAHITGKTFYANKELPGSFAMVSYQMITKKLRAPAPI